MFFFDDDCMGAIIEKCKRKMFMNILIDIGLDEKSAQLLDCLADAGCPIDSIIKGITDFAKKIQEEQKNESKT